MLHLLSKAFFQNRPYCGKIQQDISETITQAYSNLIYINKWTKKNCQFGVGGKKNQKHMMQVCVIKYELKLIAFSKLDNEH